MLSLTGERRQAGESCMDRMVVLCWGLPNANQINCSRALYSCTMTDTTRLDLPSLSFTSPTPIPSPIAPHEEPANSDSLHTPPRTSSNGSTKGKRKANEIEGGNTPPDVKKEREQKATTFAVGPRPVRASNATTVNSSHAPSSFHRQKRARLSTPTESRPGSRSGQEPSGDTAATVGSWSSRRSILRPPSRGAQSISQQSKAASLHRAPSRRSISQSSIPISALISPHAPSVARSGGTYHMRDPHKPPPAYNRLVGRSHLVASMAAAPTVGAVGPRLEVARSTRGSSSSGSSSFPYEAQQVVLDDPQLEFDARTWRTRCRIMAVVSFLTYVPFVVLVAVFARRR
ncbi:WD-REPEATS-REGION domain-containing protein [Mycena venus]|uniref:WD-REPEATS-REGION domain-containing protein n=1 Tax=Mycena venus TaxID=2733690 RepID=A0A8H6XES6_9AGAR|nr:WD-REPEATS-REGION domain-containing protein [Mycena venus]